MAVTETLQPKDRRPIGEIFGSLCAYATQFLQDLFDNRESNRSFIRQQGGTVGRLVTYDGDDIPLHYGRPSDK
jgi:hypothetical protein